MQSIESLSKLDLKIARIKKKARKKHREQEFYNQQRTLINNNTDIKQDFISMDSDYKKAFRMVKDIEKHENQIPKVRIRPKTEHKTTRQIRDQFENVKMKKENQKQCLYQNNFTHKKVKKNGKLWVLPEYRRLWSMLELCPKDQLNKQRRKTFQSLIEKDVKERKKAKKAKIKI